MMNNKLNVMIGFPNTGKTTFIAAIWKYLKDTKNDNFELDSYPSNREYLEHLVESWLQCKQVARTITGKYEKVNFTIKTNNGLIDIIIPDISGESYKKIFFSREIEKNLFSNLSEATGLIVFINSQLEDINTHNRSGGSDTSEKGERNISKVPPFLAEDTPLRIQLVDVLQSILDINRNITKIAVVISAWDLIDDNITPDKWVQNNISFLYNFIKNNFLNYRYYGISAQGGDYQEKKEELLSMDSPIDRIIVFDDNSRSNDITLPLKYLNKES